MNTIGITPNLLAKIFTTEILELTSADNTVEWIPQYDIEDVCAITFYRDFLHANWLNAKNFAETEDDAFQYEDI